MYKTIPKKIHYCWFGKNPISPLGLRCIDTWRSKLPDYELILWNEDNTDLTHPFTQYAYSNQKWAFVSDYVRLKAIYDHGGIYLDTDMFMLKNLDELLDRDFFIGAERNDLISCGIIAATAGHSVIERALNYYNEHPLTEKYFRLAIPRVMTRAIEAQYKIQEASFDEVFEIERLTIYPPNYFYPLPYVKDRPFEKKFLDYAKEETYAIHLWEGSWVSYSEFQHIRRREYYKGFKVIFKNFGARSLSFPYIRKVLRSFKDSIIRKYD